MGKFLNVALRTTFFFEEIVEDVNHYLLIFKLVGYNGGWLEVWCYWRLLIVKGWYSIVVIEMFMFNFGTRAIDSSIVHIEVFFGNNISFSSIKKYLPVNNQD